MSPERADYRRLAQSTEVGTVTRAQLAVLVQNLPCTGLINGTESHLLTTIINTAKADAFDRAGRPIVFKSNIQLGFEIDRSPGRVSRILSRLFDIGLITMQDSANFKRYPIRDGEGEISDACGIDLRILIARYGELDQLIRQMREERRVASAAMRRYRAALRNVRFSLASACGLAGGIITAAARRIERIAAMVGTAGRAQASTLRKAAALLEWLQDRLVGASKRCESGLEAPEMTCVDAESDMHKQITTPHHFGDGNNERHSANAEQVELHRAGFASKGALEESLGRGLRQDNRQSRLPTAIVALDDVWRATGASLSAWGIEAPRSWTDLVRLVPRLCKLAGVSEDARNRAVETMGQQAAAVAVAITFEKYSRQEVSSPGGYLRAMTDRAGTGELHLSRSVFGLAARNSMEAVA